jgi:hypothetical protein
MIKLSLLLALCLVILGCESTPENIYLKPECSAAVRVALPEIDSGKLYSALVLPHSLHSQDLSQLAPELLNGYDGNAVFYDLVEREKLITDMLIENETTLKRVCSDGNQ